MTTRSIIDGYTAWQRAGRRLVLATVWETAGSTYSKAGHRIVLDADGEHAGLVSGGCLEGDLAAHAAGVTRSGAARSLTYDLRDSDDELFGLGVGCQGLLRILLQPLDAQGQPFAAIAARLGDGRAGRTLTIIESADPALPPGATLVTGGDEEAFGIPAGQRAALRAALDDATTLPALLEIASSAGVCRALAAPLLPLPRLLVLGGGLDAVPLVALAATLGWRVTVADHRPAFIGSGRFAGAEAAHCLPADRLAELPGGLAYDAAVVMSHHLASDRAWLRGLAATSIGYLGLLGPAARRQRLLAELGEVGATLAPRLRGPAGLDLGGRSPEAIALSILAQVQAALSGQSALAGIEVTGREASRP